MVIVHNALVPAVSVLVHDRTGSDQAPEGFPGMAHAQEHMMFRGSPGLTGDQLAYLDAVLGGQANANTQQGVTWYSNTLPVKDLGLILRIEARRIRGVSDGEDTWARERGAIEQEAGGIHEDAASGPGACPARGSAGALSWGVPYPCDIRGSRSTRQCELRDQAALRPVA